MSDSEIVSGSHLETRIILNHSIFYITPNHYPIRFLLFRVCSTRNRILDIPWNRLLQHRKTTNMIHKLIFLGHIHRECMSGQQFCFFGKVPSFSSSLDESIIRSIDLPEKWTFSRFQIWKKKEKTSEIGQIIEILVRKITLRVGWTAKSANTRHCVLRLSTVLSGNFSDIFFNALFFGIKVQKTRKFAKMLKIKKKLGEAIALEQIKYWMKM